MLPKQPPTTGAGLAGPSSLCVLLEVTGSSQDEIYFELFFDLLQAITFLRYLICSSRISICSSFLTSSFSCLMDCSYRALTVASKVQLFFFYALKASLTCSYFFFSSFGSQVIWVLGLLRTGLLFDRLPQSFIKQFKYSILQSNQTKFINTGFYERYMYIVHRFNRLSVFGKCALSALDYTHNHTKQTQCTTENLYHQDLHERIWILSVGDCTA